MSTFRTLLQAPDFPFRIQHESPSLAFGSCFASHIGQRLIDHKFAVQLNPFGILYNPISIAQALSTLASTELLTIENLFEHQGLWHSFAHHGSFSAPTPAQALDQMNTALQNARQALPQSQLLILTLGSAHVFEHLPSNQLVANCHKLPNDQFRRRRLPVTEIVNALTDSIQQIRNKRPGLHVLLTVSPIRHIRDGLIENQRSKASLLLATAELCEKEDACFYFPSYELLIDDLRDYRFYNADMIHPSPTALDYIWSYFQQAFFTESTQQLVKQIGRLKMACAHRPIHPEAPAHQVFIQKTLEELERLEKQHPYVNFVSERQQLIAGMDSIS